MESDAQQNCPSNVQQMQDSGRAGGWRTGGKGEQSLRGRLEVCINTCGSSGPEAAGHGQHATAATSILRAGNPEQPVGCSHREGTRAWGAEFQKHPDVLKWYLGTGAVLVNFMFRWIRCAF